MKLKLVLAYLYLLTLPSTAGATIIDSINDVTFTDGTTVNWSGTCSDCLGVKGDSSFTNTNVVSGNIVLDGFNPGEDFNITSSNFMSFQYDGPSDHVDKLVVHNADYSELDEWEDLSNFALFNNGPEFSGYGHLNPDSVVDGYTHFGEGMSAEGWIAGDLSEYWLNLTFDTYVPIDDSDEYIKFSTLTPEDEARFSLQRFDIRYASDGNWSISANGVPFDIGNNAQASIANITEVPEPSSLAIFVISLIGLLRLRNRV